MAKWLEKEVVSTIDGIPPVEEWQSARCSACGKYHTTPYMYYFDEYKFCPNCGQAMNGEDTMLEDGTLVVTVADATKVGRVLVQDNQKRGGLYYADEPQTDCETCKHKHDGMGYCKTCGESNFEPKDEPTTQTETQKSNLTFEKRTMRDCYNCKRYETEGECIECNFEPKDEPQERGE